MVVGFSRIYATEEQRADHGVTVTIDTASSRAQPRRAGRLGLHPGEIHVKEQDLKCTDSAQDESPLHALHLNEYVSSSYIYKNPLPSPTIRQPSPI